MTILGIIPARKGSKRLPNKNIKYLSGKPLITWTIESALNSKFINKLILSSDDMEAIDIAKGLGCEVPFLRPASLAGDEAKSIDVIRHAINFFKGKFSYVILLQPTSPLRTTYDIDKALELLLESKKNTCVSFSTFSKPSSWLYKQDCTKGMKKLFTSKGNELKLYCPNGAIYASTTKWIEKNDTFINSGTIPYIMPVEKSVDIDTYFDWKLAEMLIKGERNSEEFLEHSHRL